MLASGSLGMTAALNPDLVEKLVLSIYEPNTPENIARTQATLSHIQNQPEAWALARHLLDRQDDKVRFFGALTIIVKLNRESNPLPEEEATDLLKHLIGWYLGSLYQERSRLVTRKLVSALSTFFIKYYKLWTRFLDHLIICLASNHPQSTDVLSDEGNQVSALEILDPLQIQAALWVTGNIADDATRLDLNSTANIGIYEALIQNGARASSLMSKGLSGNIASPLTIEASIRCLQSWITLSQKMSTKDHAVVDSLKPLISGVIDSLNVESSFDAAVELLTDTLSNFPSLITEEQYQVLGRVFTSTWSTTFYSRIIEGDFGFESVQFVQLLLSFADTKIAALVQTCHQGETGSLLTYLCEILQADGYPVAEDKIFVPVVEFWSTFAETVPDYAAGEGKTEAEATAKAREFLVKVCSHAWQRIIYPPASELTNWDSDDRTGFSYSRKDVVDLLQSVYWLIGPKLLATFAEVALSALQSSSWMRLEAAVYCIGGLAECCSDDERCDELLATIFQSSLFSTLRNGGPGIPLRARQTCLSLIEQYTEYFERNIKYLPPALELLFSTLGDESMSATASKSILRLCSSCRRHLFMDINAFISEYQRVSTGRQLDCIASERTIGALAAVAQAVPDLKHRYTTYATILQFVEDDLSNSKALAGLTLTNGIPCPDTLQNENASLHIALKALRCLFNIGKGVQVPADMVELETSNNPSERADIELESTQRKVVGIIVETQRMFPASSEVTEQICNILRTGFSESDPGPFVLPPSEVAQYLTGHSPSTPRIGLLIGSACSFISSLGKLAHQQVVVASVLAWVIGLLRQLSSQPEQPGNGSARRAPRNELDPEVTQNGIEFVTRLLPKTPGSLLQLQPAEAAEFFFIFTLQVLDGSEPLPKAAAAEFWATFVSLRDSELGTDGRLTGVMETLGPLLCQSLARNVGGNASRSELDKISEPLKKLVSRHPRTKEWLKSGLNHPSFPSNNVTAEDKSMFVKKVVSLRGLRATNQVVRDFWLASRGSNFAYAS